MDIKKLAVASGLLIALPITASAQDLAYTFIELDYVHADLDRVGDDDFFDDLDDGDGDGWGLRGSLSFTENFFIFGNYSDTELDSSGTLEGFVIPAEVDLKVVDLGVGFNTPLNDTWDFVARLAYTDFDLGDFNFGGVREEDFDFDDIDEDGSDGWYIDGGVRGQLTERLEGGIGLRYRDVIDDDVSVFGNLMYELTPQWGINVSADVGDDVTFVNAGIRWSY